MLCHFWTHKFKCSNTCFRYEQDWVKRCTCNLITYSSVCTYLKSLATCLLILHIYDRSLHASKRGHIQKYNRIRIRMSGFLKFMVVAGKPHSAFFGHFREHRLCTFRTLSETIELSIDTSVDLYSPGIISIGTVPARKRGCR